MNKLFIFSLLLILLYVSSFCGHCSEIHSSLDDIQHKIPEWFKRVYYGVKVGSESKLKIFFETIQPIWRNETKDSLIFIQPHYSLQDDIREYSLGLGYRHLLSNKKALLGVNSFFDYQQNNEHYQLGFGLEAIGNIAEARLNGYWALSDEELILNAASYREYEKVLSGLDAEVGFPIPYLPWMKIFGMGYYYDGDHTSDIYGWKTRLEIKPLLWMTIDLGAQDDNHREQEWFAQIEMHLPPDTELNRKRIPVTNRMLDLVERNFSPTTETWQEETETVISGYFINQIGDPLSNAKVEIHSEIVTAYTDTSGYFSATVAPGNHTMYVYSSDNRLLHSQGIDAEGGTTVDVSQTIHDPSLDTSSPEDEDEDTSPSNSAPSIDQLSLSSSSITYPDTSEVSFSVSDLDGDDISWTASISGGPNKGSLSGASGTVSGGSGSVTITYTPEKTDGSFTIRIHLDDGHGNKTSDSVVVTVTFENNPPEISNLSADPNLIEDAHPNSKSNITFDVNDPDGDNVKWTVTPKENVSHSSGTVHGGSNHVDDPIYRPKKGTPDGIYTFTIELDDGNGGTDTETIDIELDRN